MKKGIIVLLAVLIAAMAGCTAKVNVTSSNASGDSSSVVSNVDNGGDTDTAFDEDEITKNIKVTSYQYTSYSYNYLILVLKNNSKTDCKLEAEVTLFDSKGKIVNTESSTITAFAAGTEAVVKFSTKDKFSKFETQFSASELTYYTAVTNDLKYTVDTATDKAIVSITNNGKKTAMYTKANAIFFNKGKVVYANLTYIGDSKSEIKPGKTQRGQMSCYEKFDDVKVYIDGYAKAE